MPNKDRKSDRQISAEDLLFFIETAEFTASWDELGLDAENDLTALQLTIMAAPRRPPVVSGTGGLRKLRFVPPRWATGKSGAMRVCYVHFEDYGIVLLLVAYRKSEKDDLTPSERAAIKTYIKKAKGELDRLKMTD